MTVPKMGRSVAGVAATMMVTGGLMAAGTVPAAGQTISAVPDAQVEANVLKSLAAAPELSTQDIQSSTVYGVVTLSGTVQTEALRTRAENLVARATGVKKVVDELTLGTPTQASAAGAGDAQSQAADAANQPVLQSDGSYAPAPPQQPATPYAGPPAQSGDGSAQAYPAQNGGTPQEYPTQANNGQPAYGQPPQPPNGYPQQGQYGQQPGYQPGYPPPPPSRYGQEYAPQGGQQPGITITVPAGVLLRVRINRGLDSNHIQPGTPFDGTVLSDVAAGGEIAIPRGASVTGVVLDAKKAGTFRGEGDLSLQINSVMLGGVSYPLISDTWQRQGADKSVRTVNSALGLGVLGALVGAVAGGGAGAAVGAGVGAGVGVAGSAASPGGRVIVPPEAVLSFHLAQPAAVRTVSEQEMQRLAYAAGPGTRVQQVVRRRYYPGYYPPAPYPYPY